MSSGRCSGGPECPTGDAVHVWSGRAIGFRERQRDAGLRRRRRDAEHGANNDREHGHYPGLRQRPGGYHGRHPGCERLRQRAAVPWCGDLRHLHLRERGLQLCREQHANTRDPDCLHHVRDRHRLLGRNLTRQLLHVQRHLDRRGNVGRSPRRDHDRDLPSHGRDG
jgi:hypothetical protein